MHEIIGWKSTRMVLVNVKLKLQRFVLILWLNMLIAERNTRKFHFDVKLDSNKGQKSKKWGWDKMK